MNRLRIVGVNNTASDVVQANLVATFARGYELFETTEEYRGPVSIVGSGPSLAWTYKNLVGDVFACNSAHDFLISKGVIPKYAMVWDAHPVMEGILTPHKDVTYLIASRCHPSLFEKLSGYKVRVWHAMGGDEGLNDLLIGHRRRELQVCGGSSSVMRATHVAALLGYTKEMHLFGVDSSYTDDKSHVNGALSEQGAIRLNACGKWFTVAPWMALQAEDFKLLTPLVMGNGIKIIVHGTGLIPYVASIMGGIETPDMRVTLFERLRREAYGLKVMYHELRNSPQLLGGSHAGI